MRLLNIKKNHNQRIASSIKYAVITRRNLWRITGRVKSSYLMITHIEFLHENRDRIRKLTCMSIIL